MTVDESCQMQLQYAGYATSRQNTRVSAVRHEKLNVWTDRWVTIFLHNGATHLLAQL